MDANKPNISESDRNSILNHIINCANCALQNEDAFQKAMLSLATELRTIFDSEYCSIGIVDGDFAEECMISYEKFEDEELSKQQERFLTINRASLEENTYIVCQALKSETDIYLHQEKTGYTINNEYYQSILTSGHVKNSYVIPLRDKEKKNFGFIQFINSKKIIVFDRDISPYSDALLGLVQIIINNRKNHQELIRKENRLKDANFYSKMQDKKDNVDDLLDSIMEYFSQEFNAAVISFRIPILNDYNQIPLFYLRDIFIHPSVGKNIYNKLRNYYYSERIKKNKNEIRGVDQLRCGDKGEILASESNTKFSHYNLDLNKNTLIIPIFRDFNNCINRKRKESNFCKKGEHHHCIERFKRLYGIFRLRISNTDLSKQNSRFQPDPEETKERLAYLSKQITLLFNSIVDKHENESLKVFQEQLKNSIFIKIQDFDKCCVDIIRKSVHAKVCSIYRYDEQTKYLSLSATTTKEMQSQINQMRLFFKVSNIQKKCSISSKDAKNLVAKAYSNNPHSIYVFDIYDSQVHQSPYIERINNANEHESALAVPMIKKDGSCAGIVLLLGKDTHKHSISTTYWEHDIDHIEFIVNMLTRISESDTERLTFLSQLSHELLAPVTELVYENDLIVNIAERNIDSITKKQLTSKLNENLYRNLLLKYIIRDTEFIYSSTGQIIDYNIIKQERPKEILLDAIRLMEKDAHSNSLSIRTNISDMPPIYFDKERMMQVFLNLLKNAIRYSYKSTTIDIYYKYENSLHEIRFANYGIGIQYKEEKTIFELFHRGKEAKKKFVQGTGMGLYIIRDIMRAHGGDCYVRRLNDPTEFAITLPDIKE